MFSLGLFLYGRYSRYFTIRPSYTGSTAGFIYGLCCLESFSDEHHAHASSTEDRGYLSPTSFALHEVTVSAARPHQFRQRDTPALSWAFICLDFMTRPFQGGSLAGERQFNMNTPCPLVTLGLAKKKR